jgi:hypothetical protein
VTQASTWAFPWATPGMHDCGLPVLHPPLQKVRDQEKKKINF